MTWSKPRFCYKIAFGSTYLSITSESGTNVIANVLDRNETTLWVATSAATQVMKYGDVANVWVFGPAAAYSANGWNDAGLWVDAATWHDAATGPVASAPTAITADYLGIAAHNLGTVGASFVLRHSTDEQNWTNVASGSPSDDAPILIFFTSASKKFWELTISGASAAPQAGLIQWGEYTELEYVDAGYDPNNETFQGNVNVSQGGILQGVHERYQEKKITLTWNDFDADTGLYNDLLTWHNAVGLENFFFGWEPGEHSSDQFLMRDDGGTWMNPLTRFGQSRTIIVNLVGRSE